VADKIRMKKHFAFKTRYCTYFLPCSQCIPLPDVFREVVLSISVIHIYFTCTLRIEISRVQISIAKAHSQRIYPMPVMSISSHDLSVHFCFYLLGFFGILCANPNQQYLPYFTHTASLFTRVSPLLIVHVAPP